MEKTILDFQKEIENGEENARNAKELYELLSSYNAYSIMLLEAKSEYEDRTCIDKKYSINSCCYESQNEDLFVGFNNNDYLNTKLDLFNKDKLFLIDNETLLKINSFYIMNSNIAGLLSINYRLLKIKECIARLYRRRAYVRDPYYCDEHYEEQTAFGLYNNGVLITPNYIAEKCLEDFDNKDIREILKVQSIDEIYEKITHAKDTKVKQLILTKH